MSREHNFHTTGIVSCETIVDDDQLHIDLRLNLDEIAAAEVERLRQTPGRPPTQSQLHCLAYQIYRARRARGRLFDPQLLGEPAWDMLLALYSLPPRGEMLTVTGLSLAAEVPGSTGLRWQAKLELEGLIKRGPHLKDGRVQLVALSQQGRLLLDRYLLRLFCCHGEIPNLSGG